MFRMKTCPKCKTYWGEQYSYCPTCGKELQKPSGSSAHIKVFNRKSNISFADYYKYTSKILEKHFKAAPNILDRYFNQYTGKHPGSELKNYEVTHFFKRYLNTLGGEWLKKIFLNGKNVSMIEIELFDECPVTLPVTAMICAENNLAAASETGIPENELSPIREAVLDMGKFIEKYL